MKRIFLLFLILMSLGCQKKGSIPEASFYYWKTIFKLDDLEKSILESNHVKRLYVRYFDVKMTYGKPMPVSPIVFKDAVVSQEIVPVVFIKNEVFLSPIDTDDLVTKMVALINQINKKYSLKNSEIQIDCDWSLQSKRQYMDFMVKLKKKYAGILSATIRLHQIKYSSLTEIPQVDYGVLMFYNMGKLDENEENSIYSKKVAAQYLPSLKKYPLPLKVALPIFSWVIQYRNGKVVNLISKKDVSELKAKSVNTSNQIIIKEDLLWQGYFFKKADVLKIEEINFTKLMEMTKLLHDNLEKKPSEIIYYDLDSYNTNKFTNDVFYKIFNANF
ncbi:conserved exported hypothetical protein [Flavobacterium sp. 9AF]|uniref:hypothetical protein n=1 Tax=Flavobacterium sp. 9AF TaxID=2653142 RepID=UPI0012F117AD|nr:hypothetical protein [Flavobacterium sp. 9AF]VXB45987.1 conserved exported hypothetical protein [Flavobacterium sp. 9AF]